MYLRFGDGGKYLEFRFSFIETSERLAISKKKKDEVEILDLITQEKIEYDKPFNKNNGI